MASMVAYGPFRRQPPGPSGLPSGGLKRALDDHGDVDEPELSVEEGLDGNFVRGVEDHRPGATVFERLVRQTQAREPLPVGSAELERSHRREVQVGNGGRPPVGIGKRVLNRQAHVGDAQLRNHRSVG
jgi:hypothetical protein